MRFANEPTTKAMDLTLTSSLFVVVLFFDLIVLGLKILELLDGSRIVLRLVIDVTFFESEFQSTGNTLCDIRLFLEDRERFQMCDNVRFRIRTLLRLFVLLLDRGIDFRPCVLLYFFLVRLYRSLGLCKRI